MFKNYSIRSDVEYYLDNFIKNEIIKVKDICVNRLKNIEFLLFGSIAKGRFKNNSDIDILILIEENKSVRELRKLRHELEDYIDNLNLSRDVDIKIYNKERYIELSKEVSFEQDIIKDLVNIRGWTCG